MSMPSKFPDHPCKHCKIVIKKGDPVHKINATSSWCSNINCPKPKVVETSTQAVMEAPKTEAKSDAIKVNGPFDEAELIIRWARERAYKITMSEVTDINKLSVQEKSGLGQAQGMLTRALVDTTIELMKIHGIKTNYGDQS